MVTLQAGMARVTNCPTLLTTYANFLLEAKKDGQASRTQLQLATKNNPSLFERYFIYVSQELAKKLNTENDGLDLLGYVEFQRNYRCMVDPDNDAANLHMCVLCLCAAVVCCLLSCLCLCCGGLN